jgi:hypothetical protein
LDILLESSLELLLAHIPPPVSRAEFRRCRNDIVRVLSVFGTVGPSGVHDEHDEEIEFYSVKHPAFHVVDDMYNDVSRLHLVETDSIRLTELVITGLAEALVPNPGWGCARGHRRFGTVYLRESDRPLRQTILGLRLHQ